MNINSSEITSKIVIYINKRGITQKEFAKRAGVSRDKIWRWIKKGAEIQQADIEKIENFFKNNF